MFYSAVVLNASLPVDGALERLKAHGPETRVVLRRRLGYQLFFYPFTVHELIERLASADGALPLEIALQLHESDSAPTLDASVTTPAPSARAVLLEGEQVVGIVEERPRAAARGAPKPRITRSAPRGRDTERAGSIGRGAAANTGRFRGIDYELGVGGAGSPASRAPAAAQPERLEAFPLVDAPNLVAPGDRFDVTIGVSKQPTPDVVGADIVVSPPPGVRTVELAVLLAADGFEGPEGWRRTLAVPVALPASVRVTIPLVALPAAEPRLSFLLVHFSYKGETCGIASRKIIVRDPAQAEPAAIPGGRAWLGEPEPATAIHVAPGGTPPDLTVRLAKPDGDDATGRFVCTFESPHELNVPEPGAFAIDLGNEAQTFAKTLIDEISQTEGKPLIGLSLRGVAQTVRDKLPAVFGDVLQQVWDLVHGQQHRIPTLLFLSAEANVPWELALVDLDKSRPPFLGAQVAMARWVLGRHAPLPPPREVAVREMAVVVGDYKSSRQLRPLPEAVAEGKDLVRQYGAIPLTATHGEIADLLHGKLAKGGTTVGPEVIHFACHGEVDPTNPSTGRIYLDDASVLSSIPFRSAPIGQSHKPFLFLNACQVAQAGELLNEYAGFAGNALRAGFRGFVAPLWSVDDGVAREIAVQFYERAFGGPGGAPDAVASILRDIRGKFSAAANTPPQATYLAYVFYGHPNLLLSRQV